ncbi:MAG: tRNA preQ1(34) S-adenosylmethionine ribosyltransferase-isomerase QueA [Candidatus Tritonobacter lacicola]|nr:tRNA preQ1(34) S-adenosylmethionine ribosyltransferase-isomerase QueA [Candidatus Tritonobacter lacicola]
MMTQKLKTDLFDYDLPAEMIAQFPAEKREESKLLVYHRRQENIEHRTFSDILQYLQKGDVVVLNNTKVIPARLMGRKAGSGGKVELLLLKETGPGRWEALCKPGARVRASTELEFPRGIRATVESAHNGIYTINFLNDSVLDALIEESGLAPLPPYIKRKSEEALRLRKFDIDRYQTVYARKRGAIAAPTAGLHFSRDILDSLTGKGVRTVEITLHVGIGTFRPVKAEYVEDHRMDKETYDIPTDAANKINGARSGGSRVLVVGTTAVRALESVALRDGTIEAGEGSTSLFIYPPYPFRIAENLLTNFHLPGSTLILMLAALVGREKILELYEIAKKEGYRFYSYGDAMLVLND